jgi:hypothetical protein
MKSTFVLAALFLTGCTGNIVTDVATFNAKLVTDISRFNSNVVASYCAVPKADRDAAIAAARNAEAAALVAATKGAALPYAGLITGLPAIVQCPVDKAVN